MILFDTHAHLDMKSMTLRDAEEILDRAKAAGVAYIGAVAGSDTPGDFSKTFEIAKRHSTLRVIVGVHPHAAEALNDSIIDKIRYAFDRPETAALGEIGLDYHYNFSEPKAQRRGFIRQLKLARDLRAKVVIHTREADVDTLSILRDEGAESFGGIIHCFSASEDFAEGALSLGFYLSFSGMLTFPKADDIRAIARIAPADRLLVETDSPYLAPVPHRGKKNEPAFVQHVVEKLAEVRGISPDDAATLVFQNASTCFGLGGADQNAGPAES